MFIQKNGIHINNVSDKDRHKHPAKPEGFVEAYDKIIFLYNDPFKSVLSHFRRKWAWIQLNKLGNPNKLKEENLSDVDTFLRIIRDRKRDLYGIEEQFMSWYNAELNKPIMFLNFEDVINRKHEIEKFLETRLNWDIYKVQERFTKIVSNDIYSDCQQIYVQLYKKQKMLDEKRRKK
jgi:hypothetical protein